MVSGLVQATIGAGFKITVSCDLARVSLQAVSSQSFKVRGLSFLRDGVSPSRWIWPLTTPCGSTLTFFSRVRLFPILGIIACLLQLEERRVYPFFNSLWIFLAARIICVVNGSEP